MAAITAVREGLATVLTDALPTFDVWAYPQPVDVPSTYTVVLGTSSVEPGPTAVGGLTVKVDAWLLSAATEWSEGLDGLEDALVDVLAALDVAGVEWNTAEPAVWRDTIPAYRIETETRA